MYIHIISYYMVMANLRHPLSFSLLAGSNQQPPRQVVNLFASRFSRESGTTASPPVKCLLVVSIQLLHIVISINPCNSWI